MKVRVDVIQYYKYPFTRPIQYQPVAFFIRKKHCRGTTGSLGQAPFFCGWFSKTNQGVGGFVLQTPMPIR
jgi:hypothetical protein